MQDSTSCSTFTQHLNHMPVTIDHQELQDALKEFNIGNTDYYLSFHTNVLYLVWCTTGNNAARHVRNNGCTDIEIKGVWHDEVPEGYILPAYACVRYVLATN
jgi:predicted lipid carrier protein YhbT